MTSEILNLTSATTRLTASVLDDGNAKYTPGVSEVRSGTTTFSHSGLKHMGAQTDTGATPAVQATRTYDAFGATQSSTGSWQGPFGTAGAFGYQTEASGLHLLGHRYYDGSTGRFLTRDPIGDGSNWYAYCANDPVGYFDEDGLQYSQPPCIPPFPIPGDDGSREWVRIPGSGARADKFKPSTPVPSEKGGQPSVSWDAKHGHWDLKPGDGTRTQRFNSSGTPLPADDPHQPPRMRPQPGRPGAGTGLIPARLFLMIGLLLLPENLTSSPCAGMLHAYGRCPRCGKEFGKERSLRFTVPNMKE